MAGLLAKTNKAPAYTGLQLQTSAYGLIIPVRYGTTRCAPQLIWYGDFKAVPQNNSSSGGGKAGAVGGGGKNGSSGTYQYSTSFQMCLGEGQGNGCFNCWVSQTQSEISSQGFSFVNGAVGQAPWSYLTDNHPYAAVGYNGLILIEAVNYNMGQSASLPNLNFELAGILSTGPNQLDAVPAQMMYDMLTNPGYGMGFDGNATGTLQVLNEFYTIPNGLPPRITVAQQCQANLTVVNTVTLQVLSSVVSNPQQGQYVFNNGQYTFSSSDSGQSIRISYSYRGPWQAWANFTNASGIWMSPDYNQQAQASTLLDDIAEYSYSEIVFTSGVMNVVPRGESTVTGNGYTYTPPTNPLFDLTNQDFQENSSPIGIAGATVSTDPVIMSRKRKSDQINNIKLECVDRGNNYASAVVEWTDKALIDNFGRRAGNMKSAHLFADFGAANTAVQLLGQKEYILNTYSFTLDQRYACLDPMDIVTLTEAQSGLNRQWVRIIEIQENDDGTISFCAEEYPAGTGAAATYKLNVGQGFIPNYNTDPGVINPPVIFEPPVQITGSNGLEVWAAISGVNPNTWGGCDVYVSLDNGGTYKFLETIHAPSVMGVLSANFATGSDPDTTHTLSVDLSMSYGQLSSGAQSDADNNTTLCYVDGEFVSYEVATLTAPYKYNLGTYLRRGQYGSVIGAHSSGSNFVRLNNFLVKVPLDSHYVGQTIYLKFPSFNQYDGGEQTLAEATAYAHTIQGPPTQFVYSNLTASPGVGSVQLRWINPSTNTLNATEVWMSTTNDLSTAVKINDTAYPANYYAATNLTQGTTYYFWVRGRDLAGNHTPYFPTSTTGGIPGTPQVAVPPGSLTPASFAAGVQPVTLVSGLPNPGTWTGTSVVLNIQDGQLYRLFAGAWTLAIPASALSTQIQAGQLAANSVTAGVIAVGALSANYITSGTFTGLTFQTASSGQRVVIDAATGSISMYSTASPNQAVAYVGLGFGYPVSSRAGLDSGFYGALWGFANFPAQYGVFTSSYIYAGQARTPSGGTSGLQAMITGDATGMTATATSGLIGVGGSSGGVGYVGVVGSFTVDGVVASFYASGGAYFSLNDFVIKSVNSGVIQFPNNYTAGAPSATGYITIKGRNGTTYKLLAST